MKATPQSWARVTPEQGATLQKLRDRHGSLGSAECPSGDVYAHVFDGSRAWLIASDGRTVPTTRRFPRS